MSYDKEKKLLIYQFATRCIADSGLYLTANHTVTSPYCKLATNTQFCSVFNKNNLSWCKTLHILLYC